MIHPEASRDECMEEIGTLEREIKCLQAELEQVREILENRGRKYAISEGMNQAKDTMIDRLKAERDDLYRRLSKYPAEMRRLRKTREEK